MADTKLGRGEVHRAAAISVGVAIFLTISKMVVGYLTNSIGMISEALHSGLDLLAATVTFAAVRASSIAADSDHLYGHWKIENFSALFETLLLWLTAGWIMLESVTRILVPEAVEAGVLGLSVMALSIFLNFERSRMLYRIARKHGSQALEADALHFVTDAGSSLVVLIGLLFVASGVPLGDPLSAIGVAIIILFVSARLGKRAYDALVDRAPRGVREEIAKICEKVPGVVGCRRVRVRTSGPKTFVDIVVAADSSVTLEAAHEIADIIETRIESADIRRDVIVHVEPVGGMWQSNGPDMYSELRNTAMTVPGLVDLHNVRMRVVKEDIFLTAHMEVSPTLSLEQAHEISKILEKRLHERMPRLKGATLHIEPAELNMQASDVTAAIGPIVKQVVETVNGVSGTFNCHDIVVVEEPTGLSISLTCCVDGKTSLGTSDDLADKIESRVKQLDSRISTVVVHLEPISQA